MHSPSDEEEECTNGTHVLLVPDVKDPQTNGIEKESEMFKLHLTLHCHHFTDLAAKSLNVLFIARGRVTRRCK